MSIFDQTRLGELFRLINNDNPEMELDVSSDNVTVSNVTALGTGTRDTSALLTGTKYSGFRGTTTVKYNRIDLATLAKNIAFYVAVPPETPQDLDSILPFVNAKLGISLEPGDYVNAPLTANQDTMRFEGTFNIAVTHPIYRGSLKVSVWGYTVSLGDLVQVRELGVLKDQSPHVTGKVNASMLTFGHDYTDLQGLWVDWTPGTFTPGTRLNDLPAKNLAVALSAIDGLPWIYADAAKAFNLRGAHILYDGVPVPQWAGSAANPEPNYAYDRVMIIQPNATYCNNLAIGNGWGLMIHYDLITG